MNFTTFAAQGITRNEKIRKNNKKIVLGRTERHNSRGQRSIKKREENLRNKISVVCEKIKSDDKELRNGINVQSTEHARVPLPSYSLRS